MSDQRVVVLCPGQGAQAVGMGQAWFAASRAAREVFERADADLHSLPAPLSTLCFEGPADQLNRTDVAQPALFAAGVASVRGLEEAGHLSAGEAVAYAGLSLGEYTALHLAGSISFEDGLQLVALRGLAMQEAAEASPSGMVALIGADEASAQALCEAASDGDVLVPANFNAPGQVVISGTKAACERATAMAPDHKLRAAPLAVAGAFHSPLMQPAADRLSAALESTAIEAPHAAVLSNVTGTPHDADAASIRRRLVEQLTSPVRWSACCEWLVADQAGAAFHEAAPGKTLAGLMRRISRETLVQTHDVPG